MTSIIVLVYNDRDCAKRAKKSPAVRHLNFSEEPPQIVPQFDSDFVFY